MMVVDVEHSAIWFKGCCCIRHQASLSASAPLSLMHSEEEFEKDALRKSMLESGNENSKSCVLEERVSALEKQLEEHRC